MEIVRKQHFCYYWWGLKGQGNQEHTGFVWPEDNRKQERKRQDDEMNHCEELKTPERGERGALKNTIPANWNRH